MSILYDFDYQQQSAEAIPFAASQFQYHHHSVSEGVPMYSEPSAYEPAQHHQHHHNITTSQHHQSLSMESSGSSLYSDYSPLQQQTSLPVPPSSTASSVSPSHQPLDYILGNPAIELPIIPSSSSSSIAHHQLPTPPLSSSYCDPLSSSLSAPPPPPIASSLQSIPKAEHYQINLTNLKPVVTPSNSTSLQSMPTPPPDGLDFNGRKPRKWRNRKYKCSHCSLSFFDKDLYLYAQHVEEVERQKGGMQLTRRKYKCADKACPWHKIGFLRKLEAQKHYVRKHGIPRFQCRFWSEAGEKMPGCGVCTTRWHADSGNRSRHEQAIHGKVWCDL